MEMRVHQHKSAESNKKMKDVKTRKTFLKGKQSLGSQCASIQSSVFSPRGSSQESKVPDKKMVVRLHCFRYGKYYQLKEISFTQKVV